MTGALGAGRVAHERKNPLGAQLTQAGKAWTGTAHRGVIELEVAGVDHQAHRGLDRKAHAVRDGVRDGKELDLKWTDGDRRAGRDGAEVEAVDGGVLRQLCAYQSQRERRCIDRGVSRQHIAQQVGQAAYVVLVAVGNDDTGDLVGVIAQVRIVGQDKVDAQHVELREHDARVYDQDVAVIFEKHHVLADFAQPTQRDDAQSFRHNYAVLWLEIGHRSN